MDKLLLTKKIDFSFNTIVKENTTKKLKKQYDLNMNNILAFLSNSKCEFENLKNIIKPDSYYIAEIPIEIKKGLETGQLQIMKSRDGKYLSNIIDTSLPKNRNIVHQLRLKEEKVNIASSGLNNLSNNLSNIAIQYGIAQLSKELEKCSLKIDQIKTELMNDRIGRIQGASNTLEQAFLMKDNKILICNAISDLNKVRGMLMNSLYEIGEFVDKINDNTFIHNIQRLFQQIKYSECEKIYYQGQEIYQGILNSSILLAIAYQALGEYKAIEKVFDPLDMILNEYRNKFLKLDNILYIDDNEYYKWYKDYNEILQIKNNFQKKLNLSNYNIVQVEFKGEDLLKIS